MSLLVPQSVHIIIIIKYWIEPIYERSRTHTPFTGTTPTRELVSRSHTLMLATQAISPSPVPKSDVHYNNIIITYLQFPDSIFLSVTILSG